jgi:hypothetical protein
MNVRDIKASFTWQQSEPTSGLLTATVIRPGAAPKEFACRDDCPTVEPLVSGVERMAVLGP